MIPFAYAEFETQPLTDREKDLIMQYQVRTLGWADCFDGGDFGPATWPSEHFNEAEIKAAIRSLLEVLSDWHDAIVGLDEDLRGVGQATHHGSNPATDRVVAWELDMWRSCRMSLLTGALENYLGVGTFTAPWYAAEVR